MGIIVRKPSSTPSWVLRRAKQIGADLARVGRGVRRVILDGYIIDAKASAGSAVVTVLDMPFQVAMCQPYIYEPAPGEYNTALWRRLDLPQGRDAVELPGYRPLTYAPADPEADVTDSNIRYTWAFGGLAVGDPPADATFFARGTYNQGRGAVTLAAVLSSDYQQWLFIGRINVAQAMQHPAADEPYDATPTQERTTNVTVSGIALAAALRPAVGESFSQYTICPNAVTFGLSGGVLAANTFVENPDAETHQTDWRVGLTVAWYDVAGVYSKEADQREASLRWRSDLDTTLLPAPLTNGNVHMHRMAATEAGGLLVAQVINPVTYLVGEGERVERVRGLVAAQITPGGLEAVTILEATALFPSESQAFASHPVLGVIGASGPAVVCHRIRKLRDGEDVLRQDAADIGLAIVDAGGLHPLDLGAFIPVVYIKYNAAWVDGRIAAGIWDFPVGPTGDWTAGLMQNACQCGEDELAVAVRPAAQFGAGATDIHIAVVRISTGKVLSVGPPVLRGSLWAFVSLTCWKRGVWVGSWEEAPAHLLLNLFREGGAPAEPESIVRGTYRSFDSGRTAELVVNLGATLCYAMGSPLHRVPIGG